MSWLDDLNPLNALSNVASSAIGYYGQQKANRVNIGINRDNNAFSARQAGLNRDFQERMSNTSWQRGVTDMRAAGVNPMLAFSQGGASSPSGTSAQGIAQANQQNELATASSNARELALTQAQIQNLNAQSLSSAATARKTIATAAEAEAKAPLWDIAKKGTLATAKAVDSLFTSSNKSYMGRFQDWVHRKAHTPTY